MNSNKISELVEKGVKLAYKRLLEEKSKNNEDLIICENGKIKRLNAKTTLKALKKKGRL